MAVFLHPRCTAQHHHHPSPPISVGISYKLHTVSSHAHSSQVSRLTSPSGIVPPLPPGTVVHLPRLIYTHTPHTPTVSCPPTRSPTKSYIITIPIPFTGSENNVTISPASNPLHVGRIHRQRPTRNRRHRRLCTTSRRHRNRYQQTILQVRSFPCVSSISRFHGVGS